MKKITVGETQYYVVPVPETASEFMMVQHQLWYLLRSDMQARHKFESLPAHGNYEILGVFKTLGGSVVSSLLGIETPEPYTATLAEISEWLEEVVKHIYKNGITQNDLIIKIIPNG